MLVLPCPNIFSIQYLIHSQHIVTHLKCIVTIWNAPYFRNGREMQDPLPLWQGAEDRGGPGSISRREQPVPVLPQRQENADVAAVVARDGGPGQYGTAVLHGHSSRMASDGRIPETFHTETRAARAFTTNITAATTNVTISADRKGEVSTGQGARELSGNAGILT